MEKSRYDEEDDAKSSRRGDDEKSSRGGRGRRARNEEPAEEASAKIEESRNYKEEAPGPGPGGKGRRRRAADEEETAAPSKSGGGGWMNSSATKPVQNEVDDFGAADDIPMISKSKKEKDADDEILVIPDLDEDAGTDADHRVAHAPRNLNRKVPTRAELENDVKASVPSVEGGFDLTVLLGTLVPHSMVYEDDVPWTFDTLLREVTEEINASNAKIQVVTPAPEAPVRVRGETVTKA